MFENSIAKCKPVEAEPVRHGHWELVIEGREFFMHNIYECSACKRNHVHERSKYCSECGAKMEEVE